MKPSISVPLSCSLLLAFPIAQWSVRAFPTHKAFHAGRSQIVPRNLHSLEAVSGGGLVDGESSTISEASAAALDWSFLDDVYLIHCPNGDVDGNRIKSTKSILDEVNLLDAVTIKEFETDDEDRVRGCYTSHVSVFRDILKTSPQSSQSKSGFNFLDIFQKKENNASKGDDNVKALIFEDNLSLGNRELAQEIIDAVSNFIQNNENDWDVIHLAYIPYVPDLKVSKTDDKRIVKLSTSNQQSALGTTAYIINSKAMKRIVEEDDRKGYTVSIPDAMADLFGDSRYALNPTAFVRAPATKSLVNPQLDDLRSILFRPTVVSIVQQILVETGLSTTVLLPIVILLLILTSINSGSSTLHAAQEYLTYGTLDGPLIFPIINAMFSLFSLGLIIQGILLAPAPNDAEEEES